MMTKMTLTNYKEFPNFLMPETGSPSDLEEGSSLSAETEVFLAQCHDDIVRKKTIRQAIEKKTDYYWNTIMLMCGSALKKFIHPLGEDAMERLALSVAQTLWQHGVKIKSPTGEFIDSSNPTPALERRREQRRKHQPRGSNDDPNLSPEEEGFVAVQVNEICGRIDSGALKISTDHGLLVSIGRTLKGLEGRGEYESNRFFTLRNTITARVCEYCNQKGLVLKPKSQGRSSDPKTVEPTVPTTLDEGAVPDFSPLLVGGSDEEIFPSDASQNDEDDEEALYDDSDLLGIDPSSPARAKPGSEEKVLTLAARYAAGQPLWHEGDYVQQGPTTDREKEMATKRNVREANEMRAKLEAAMG